MKKIEVPDQVRRERLIPVVSMSGGKDSLATALALREAGFGDEVRYVFSDTGWEHPLALAYLDYLEATLNIKIERIRGRLDFVELVAHYRMFPSRTGRFCTEQLKVLPIKKYHDDIRDTEGETVSVVGIRHDESESRASALHYEDDDRWGGPVWRPIIKWTVEDVLAIHHRHGVDVNPLYRMGHNRVGCYPCIFSSRGEIALVAKNAPEKIAQIRELELQTTNLRKKHNEERLAEAAQKFADVLDIFRDRHGDNEPLELIQLEARRLEGKRAAYVAETDALVQGDALVVLGEAEVAKIKADRGPGLSVIESELRSVEKMLKFARPHKDVRSSFFTSKFRDEGMVMGIDEVVGWAQAERGGRDHVALPLLDEPDGGCYRWGFCDGKDTRRFGET